MFKLFRIGNVFVKIDTPKIKAKANDFPTEYSNEYCIPLLTAGAENQGLNRYARRSDCPMVIKNCISVSANGANSGICFYQPDDFAVLQDAYAIRPIGHNIQNVEEGLYLTGALNKSVRDNHDWVNKAGWNHIKNDNIELPVVESSDPNHKYTINDIDWQYMQDRIAELEQDRIAELEQDRIAELDAYLKASGLDDYELTDEDKKALSLSLQSTSNKANALENDCKNGQIRFKKYVMHDIFEPIKVKKAKKADVRDYKTAEFCVPVVYAKFGDNGIMYWGRKGEFTAFGNVISIVYNGVISAGKVYAQEEPTGILAESYLIRYKYGDIPFLANLYMAQVIEHKIYPLYSRENLAIWNNRVENEVIELPITASGDINFGYMERYIRAIEKLTIAGVVKFRDKEIAAARQAVNA